MQSTPSSSPVVSGYLNSAIFLCTCNGVKSVFISNRFYFRWLYSVDDLHVVTFGVCTRYSCKLAKFECRRCLVLFGELLGSVRIMQFTVSLWIDCAGLEFEHKTFCSEVRSKTTRPKGSL